MTGIDGIDGRILRTLDASPRATVQYVAEHLGIARGTAHSHIGRLFEGPHLCPVSSRLRPASVGRPLRAQVTAEVDQSTFEGMIGDLSKIPEVVECVAISGASDLAIEILARDADDVYRITQRIMECRGIRRTATSLVLRELIPRRMSQLLD
ncbi:Lrp/AsnC family transcriptional regulator [Kineosporia succinea]|uniref:DNA-binding Lrp family transcriptional regulator n=1 Tax=Kineosporia succinea TaxID=84632 RepID=A0ABT9PEI4_9ACTN|nr:Lrp/AsnC family transcriptional regulator [Kineosporia succinea]MDP9830882.1 DNA-binding Lrp family transcriptional regulator [Kineosporia succinea]